MNEYDNSSHQQKLNENYSNNQVMLVLMDVNRSLPYFNNDTANHHAKYV